MTRLKGERLCRLISWNDSLHLIQFWTESASVAFAGRQIHVAPPTVVR